ncbi:hypothetical protein QP938_06860 [Porticoccaceae bacterium LTM1]|nr:hypothetical protein QP938_06860 [Porticoccaceae bacterium LTM1]
MKDHSQQPDSLDALFATAREQEKHLPDDGFSGGVMAAIAHKQINKGISLWQKNALIMILTATGSALAATIFSNSVSDFKSSLASLLSFHLGSLSLMVAAAALFAIMAAALWADKKEII